MRLEKGNMWSVFGNTGLFLITTNPIIRNDGCVVMGRGIAREARDKFPTLAWDFGQVLKAQHEGDETNVDYIGTYAGQKIGFFMVKDHWQSPASLDIINQSLVDMCLAQQLPKQFDRIDMNFPGIGNGKLTREAVLPVLEEYLPDNVHVWEYGV